MPERLPRFGRGADGKLPLRESWVLFLDVLGAREFAKSSDAQAHLENLASALDEVRGFADDDLDEPWFRSQWFSDNMVMAAPLWAPTGEGESEFGAFVSAAAEIQFQLALRGVFVRGGIALGPHYQDDQFAFGEALVEAVDIERRAVFPRILLSEAASARVKDHLRFYGSNPSHSPQNTELLVDQGGGVFVNYLDSASNYVEFDIRDNAEMIERHRDRVQEQLTKHQMNTPVWAKYVWLAAYHNAFCRKRKLDDYLIDESMAKWTFSELAGPDSS